MTSNRRRPHQNVGGSFIPRCTIDVFCYSELAHSVVKKTLNNPILGRAQTKLIQGSINTVLSSYKIGKTPDVLVVEFMGDADELEALADICSEETKVIIIGADNDVILYRKLMARGIEDYLFFPLNEDIVISSFMRIFAGERPFNAAKVIAVAGAGGGMGNSTIAQSIAYLLSTNPSSRVALIDLDFYFGASTLNFDFTPAKGLRDLMHFSGSLSVNDIELLLVEQRPRLYVLASEPTLEPLRQFDIETLIKIIDIVSLTADFVVIDLPSGWGDIQNEVVCTSDAVCLVAEPTLAGFRNVAAIKAHLDADIRVARQPRLVINQYDSKASSAVDIKDFSKLYGAMSIVTVPQMTELLTSADEQVRLPLEVSGARKLHGIMSDLVGKLLSEAPAATSSAPKARSLLSKFLTRSA